MECGSLPRTLGWELARCFQGNKLTMQPAHCTMQGMSLGLKTHHENKNSATLFQRLVSEEAKGQILVSSII
jgi:hypothetical protein